GRTAWDWVAKGISRVPPSSPRRRSSDTWRRLLNSESSGNLRSMGSRRRGPQGFLEVPGGSLGFLLALSLVAVPVANQQPSGVVPTAGMVISESARIRPGTYRLTSRDLNTPAI